MNTKKLCDEINHWVNHSMTYVQQLQGDKHIHGVEVAKTLRGDCDDYVILKAHMLHQRGVPKESMCLGGVSAGAFNNRIDHAVLVVKVVVTKGFWLWKREVPVELILDNRWDTVYTTEEIREYVSYRKDIKEWI